MRELDLSYELGLFDEETIWIDDYDDFLDECILLRADSCSFVVVS